MTPRNGRSRVRIEFAGDDDGMLAINRKLNEEGIAVLGFQEEERDLEHMFMRVTKGLSDLDFYRRSQSAKRHASSVQIRCKGDTGLLFVMS